MRVQQGVGCVRVCVGCGGKSLLMLQLILRNVYLTPLGIMGHLYGICVSLFAVCVPPDVDASTQTRIHMGDIQDLIDEVKTSRETIAELEARLAEAKEMEQSGLGQLAARSPSQASQAGIAPQTGRSGNSRDIHDPLEDSFHRMRTYTYIQTHTHSCCESSAR